MPFQRDICSNQLHSYRSNNEDPVLLTSENGAPSTGKSSSLCAGDTPSILLRDVSLCEEICNFNRERIPTRACFSKGFGAFGYFECCSEILKNYTIAAPFSEMHKQTPVAVRFSRMQAEMGSPDTCRDLRGISIKFYSLCGNLDLVCSNLPVFFIRDPILFSSLVRSQRKNPVTSVCDADMYWDFLSLNPESTHILCMLYSTRGIPASYTNMNAYSVNTYTLRNASNEIVYCRFHFISSNLECMPEQDANMQSTDPDYMTRDLFRKISIQQFPSWDMYMQIMTADQMTQENFNIFDCTKIWSHKLYPLCLAGKLTLNRLAADQFGEFEQMCFSPGNLIPGVEVSVGDLILQARVFAYADAQRYRIGKNYNQIPCNRPICDVNTTSREGKCWYSKLTGVPIYYPNSFNSPCCAPQFEESKCPISGEIGRYAYKDDKEFDQPKVFYENVLSQDEKIDLACALARSLAPVLPYIRKRAIKNFNMVSEDLAQNIEHFLNNYSGGKVTTQEKQFQTESSQFEIGDNSNIHFDT